MMFLTDTVFTYFLKLFILTWCYMKSLIIWDDCRSGDDSVRYVRFSLQECIGNHPKSLRVSCDDG
jgi:hypothetical protein